MRSIEAKLKAFLWFNLIARNFTAKTQRRYGRKGFNIDVDFSESNFFRILFANLAPLCLRGKNLTTSGVKLLSQRPKDSFCMLFMQDLVPTGYYGYRAVFFNTLPEFFTYGG